MTRRIAAAAANLTATMRKMKMTTTMKMRCFCPTPPKQFVDEEKGEIICIRCGKVLESSIAKHSEPNERNTNAMHDFGIGSAPIEAHDLKVNRISQRIAEKKTGKERSTIRLLFEVRPMLEKISATDSIRDECFGIVRKAAAAKIARGRTITDVAAACVLASCRTNGKIITEKEICRMAGSNRKSTRKIYGIIQMEANITPRPLGDRRQATLVKIASDIGMPQTLKKTALEILESLSREGAILEGKNPHVTAATILYYVANSSEKKGTAISFSKISRISGVSDVAIKNFAKVAGIPQRLDKTREKTKAARAAAGADSD